MLGGEYILWSVHHTPDAISLKFILGAVGSVNTYLESLLPLGENQEILSLFRFLLLGED